VVFKTGEVMNRKNGTIAMTISALASTGLVACAKNTGSTQSSTERTKSDAKTCKERDLALFEAGQVLLLADPQKILAGDKFPAKSGIVAEIHNYISGPGKELNGAWIDSQAWTVITTNPKSITIENSCVIFVPKNGGPKSSLPLFLEGSDGADGFPALSSGWVEVTFPLDPRGVRPGPEGSGAYLCGSDFNHKSPKKYVYGPHFVPAFENGAVENSLLKEEKPKSPEVPAPGDEVGQQPGGGMFLNGDAPPKNETSGSYQDDYYIAVTNDKGERVHPISGLTAKQVFAERKAAQLKFKDAYCPLW
jgi:uncharacterized protein YodC (DUF2158 family)